MYGSIKKHLQNEIEEIKEAGLYKTERIITSSQDAVIKISTGEEVINFCANNYLGLSNHPEVIQAAKDTMDTHGFGVSSVRFICGTQDIHKKLESKIAEFYQTEDTILYAAAFDANGGVFEPILSKEDAIISDSLNHASIIDGVRLCKASRYRYDNNNMDALETQLIEASKNNHRFKIIVTDDEEMKILGMRALGESASSAIQAVALLIEMDRSIVELENLIHPHPSIIEGIQECVRMLQGSPIFKSSIFTDKLKAYSYKDGVCTPLNIV